MGGVASFNTDVFPDVRQHLDLSEAEFLAVASGNLEKLTIGEITTDEFWNRFSERYGKKVKEELFGKYFHPRLNPETVDLINTIKRQARVVCGTNTFDPHYHCHLALGDYDIFDAVYASNMIGRSKPNPEFFTYILETEGFKPEQAVFVDDTEMHVVGAKNVGITAFLFETAASLRLEFDRLSLLSL
jgi:putative hydrolase of the HAD superfamily